MQEIMFHSCLQKQLKGVHCDLEHKDERVEFVSNYEVFQDSLQRETLHESIKDLVKKARDIDDSFLLTTICSILLLVCCVQLVVEMVNANGCERTRIIDYVNMLFQFSSLLDFFYNEINVHYLRMRVGFQENGELVPSLPFRMKSFWWSKIFH